MFPDATEVERLRYRHGQRLRSRDFRDQAALDAQLRWWHNRALHAAYGIATGLEVQITVEAGGSSVQVSGGVAYDCYGRELVLPRERVLPVPDRDVNMTLLLRRTDAFFTAATPGGACGGRGADSAVAELVWRESAGLTFRDGVTLCQVPFVTSVSIALHAKTSQAVATLSGGGLTYEAGILTMWGVMSRELLEALLGHLAAPGYEMTQHQVNDYGTAVVTLFERSQIEYGRNRSRRLVRPRMGTGATIAGSTAWSDWLPENRLIAGLEVRIDTRAAGFTEVPCCFASLRGLPALPVPVLEHTDQVTAHGFVFRFWLFLPDGHGFTTKNQQTSLLLFAQKYRLFVRWWAVQPAAGSVGLAR